MLEWTDEHMHACDSRCNFEETQKKRLKSSACIPLLECVLYRMCFL
jgi:hypothetical protein